MNKLLTRLAANAPLRYPSPARLFQIRYQRAKRGSCTQLLFSNKAGLCRLMFRSNKPKAKALANWLCKNILPKLRKTGFFGTLSIKVRINISKQIDSISLQVVNNCNAFRRKWLPDPLRRLCNIVSRPIPPDAWLAKHGNLIDLSNGLPAQLS